MDTKRHKENKDNPPQKVKNKSMKHKTNGNVSRTTEQKPTHRASGKGRKNPTKMNTEISIYKSAIVPYFCQIIFIKSAKIRIRMGICTLNTLKECCYYGKFRIRKY